MGVRNSTSRLGHGPGSLFYNIMNPSDIGDTSVFYWNGNTYTPSWSAASAWLLGIRAPTINPAANTINFNSLLYVNPSYADSYSVQSIVIGDGFTVTGPLTVTGNLLALGTGGINMKSSAGDFTIASTTVALCGNQTWINNSTNGNLNIVGIISGSSVFVKDGVGCLNLSGTNTFTSQLSILNGTVSVISANNLSVAGNLGASGLTIPLGSTGNIGTIRYAGSAVNITTRTFTVTGGGGQFDIPSTVGMLQTSGVINGPGGLTKIGPGIISLAAANTYTGSTSVLDGVLLASNANSVPGGIAATGGTAPLILNGGVLGLSAANMIRLAGLSATRIWIPAGRSGFSGMAGSATSRSINIGSLTWGNSAFNPSTYVLQESSATGPIDAVNFINLGSGIRTIYSGSTAFACKISGAISSGSLVKTGPGNTTSTATNSFNTGLSVMEGTFQLGIDAATGGLPSVVLGSGLWSAPLYIAPGATLCLFSEASNQIRGTSGSFQPWAAIWGEGSIIKSCSGQVTFGQSGTSYNHSTWTGKLYIRIGFNTPAGAGTTVVNTFNSVVGGTSASALGAPTTVANGTIDFGSSSVSGPCTLKINNTTTNETTDRVINFAFNGASSVGGMKTIDSSGSLIIFSSAPTLSGATTGDITLQGSTSGEFTQGIPFQFATLAKAGAGVWTLSGTTTPSVSANITGGTLRIGGVLSGGPVTVNGGRLMGPGIVASTLISVMSTLSSAIQGSLTTGTLAVSSVTLSGIGSQIIVGTDGSTNVSLISSNGVVILGGATINFDITLNLNAGSYDIVTSNNISGSFVQGTLPVSRSWTSLSIVGNNLVAVLA